MLFNKTVKPKTWLQGLIHGEKILNRIMNEYDNEPSEQELKAEFKCIFSNYCNSFSSEKDFNKGVMEYFENYLNPTAKNIFNNQEVYIP